MRKCPLIQPASLGATLYVPADRTDLLQIATGGKYPHLRSVIFCLEDAVSESSVPAALENLRLLAAQLATMAGTAQARPIILVRPRHAAMLKVIASMKGADQIAGFVLPKITAESLDEYLDALQSDQHCIMPTIETREAFDFEAMKALRSKLLLIKDRVALVRIGGNDLLRTIGGRRSKNRTIYDGPMSSIIANLVTTFVPYGFLLSAPVCDNFSDLDLLQEEVELDLDHGLFTKSAIHPNQVDLIHNLYKVSAEELISARAILDTKAPAVFSINGAMMEPATHTDWAKNIITRSEIFGTLSVSAKILSSL